MKTYLKRSYEKSLSNVYYSSSDASNNFPSRVSIRTRIIQPSTKEQQRLLLAASSSTPRLQHVHSGKYGIKPIWPSDDLTCELWRQGKRSSKYRSSSIGSLSWANQRDRCSRHTSDSYVRNHFVNFFLSTSYISYLNEEYGSLLLLTSASLLLLLLIFIVYRLRSSAQNSTQHHGQRRRLSREDIRHLRESSEYRLASSQVLPTITEESPSTLSPSNSESKFTPLLKSTSTTPSTIIADNNDLHHPSLSPSSSSSSTVQEKKPSTSNAPATENLVRISLLPKQEQSVTINPRRRSRFEQTAEKPTDDASAREETLAPPVIVRKTSLTHENVIRDDYTSLEEIDNAVKEVGLERSQLIFGIDYTISNLETGKNSFNGLSLHSIQEGLLNPYQSVITIIGRTLEKYDSDTLIPAFGFGDRSTLDRKIFPLRPDGSYCKGFRGVLDAYNEITPKVRMSGPTNFAPLIREAVRIVKKTKQYHILVIVADGQVTNEKQTKDAIVEASNYPLSIVMIGVGDGPWDMMEEFDDSLPTRQFDNFQFVNYNSVVEASTNTDSSFALRALMEIPSQYAAIKKLGLLKNN
ncbi:unnamed protein product [Adineta ricciae]|uniref:VWFA domain-containing protein n=1 Tax=Adineta ricciae TaxID=249248 RepID=A0A814K4N4_ADIRI|nr:unnamed protein product [Adineta ricciae]CAF1270099.1 unnamed protein product [Adineta ricciae]